MPAINWRSHVARGWGGGGVTTYHASITAVTCTGGGGGGYYHARQSQGTAACPNYCLMTIQIPSGFECPMHIHIHVYR